MAGILTMNQLVALETIADAAQRTAKVAVLTETGDVIYGTARSIGDERGNFLDGKTDVRDAYLRITARSGMEYFFPVADLMEQVGKGEFAQYDWR